MKTGCCRWFFTPEPISGVAAIYPVFLVPFAISFTISATFAVAFSFASPLPITAPLVPAGVLTPAALLTMPVATFVLCLIIPASVVVAIPVV